LLGVADVGDDRDALLTERGDARRRIVRARRGNIEDADVGALAREQQGDRLAQPPGRAGD
jgi:hypothetical protein